MVNHPLHGERRVAARAPAVPICDRHADRGLSLNGRAPAPVRERIDRILGKCS
jgi:hypothetical protein